MTDCWEEFPEEWFEHAILSPEKAIPFITISASNRVFP